MFYLQTGMAKSFLTRPSKCLSIACKYSPGRLGLTCLLKRNPIMFWSGSLCLGPNLW